MRNKKFLIVFAALVVSVSAGLFASGTVGIGVQGGYVPSPHGYGDTAITFKIPNVPPVFAVNVGIWGNQVHRVGATADWWLANPNIVGVLNWYYGPGLAAGATFNVRGDRACDLYVGGRFVVGLNAWIVDFLEIYLQAAGQVGIDTSNDHVFDWAVPVNLGIRFWF